MGQLAKDWQQLRASIRQKDQQAAALQQQVTSLQQQLSGAQAQLTAAQQQIATLQQRYDPDDQQAASEIRQLVAASQPTPAADKSPVPPSSSATAAVTTFSK